MAFPKHVCPESFLRELSEGLMCHQAALGKQLLGTFVPTLTCLLWPGENV